ncbi:MAG: DNA polymerase ligase N-terminal domain-containing protein [Candidatus Aenigmarchaeota archaeon]
MKKLIFVVHCHESSHLHWDIRLEMDGVLKSWAIPKEPPTKPKVKRLAIQVNDHDLEYAKFEGKISEGYGTGKVKIWDKGTYEIINRKDSKIVFKLNGKKLKGEYVILRFKKAGEKDWLIFKK